jgi:hypothetical protein
MVEGHPKVFLKLRAWVLVTKVDWYGGSRGWFVDMIEVVV